MNNNPYSIATTRTCTICGLTVKDRDPCPHCSDESTWRDVSTMTPQEKVAEFDLWTDTLQTSVNQWLKRLSQIFGRPVYVHEITTPNRVHMHAELLTGVQPTMGDIVDLIPEDKQILIDPGSEDTP